MCEDINVCKNRIGKNIDEIRRERKITIQKLSEKMGTSTVVISRHLNGKTDIRTNIVIKYAEALGCSPADFFKDTADRSSFSIETDLIHTYPYNLACAVFEPYGKSLTEDEKWDIAYGTYVPEFIDVINESLSERERKILEYRFKHLMTLEETGKEIGVTRERIRQIEARAIRTLRKPDRVKRWDIRKMSVIIEDARTRKETEAENIQLREQVKEYKKQVSELQEKLRIKKVKEMSGTLYENMDIDEFEFPVRAYNCLKRYGIEKAWELCLLSEDDLLCMQNLGKRSVKDIEKVLKKYGLNLCRDGKHSENTIGQLYFRNEQCRPGVMVSLRGAGIFTLKELSEITEDNLHEIIRGGPARICGTEEKVFEEIKKTIRRAGIRLKK